MRWIFLIEIELIHCPMFLSFPFTSIPPEKSLEIWTRFLSFESAVGDLSSLVKIEKRRAKVLESKTEFSDTTLLVDRYRYLDLFPVSSTELKVLTELM